MKNLICLILFQIICTTYSLSQNGSPIDTDCGTKKSDRYTLTHSDSITTFMSASYVGGEKALKHYLDSNLRSYYDTIQHRYNKYLYARITISEQGAIENIELLTHIHNCSSCDSITIAIIRKMPDWIAAYGIYKNGVKRNQKDQFILPFKF